jgi:hypothetical protein
MKIFNATCAGGIVTANGGVVPDCPILGEGGTSSGYLVIAEEKFVYLPKTTPDVKSFLAQVENLCDKLTALCTKISAITVTCSSPGSPSSPPINAADFAISSAEISAVKTSLTTLKNTLK